jgi:hypothetical protein
MQALDFINFKIREVDFDHHSLLHGINHSYRVMYHVLAIGEMAGLNHEIKEAFCGAFIHDMARKHDGYCQAHGGWSARRKFPLFKELFISCGISGDGLENIKLAVTNHSLNDELNKNHPGYKTVALLKDADALDRIRISSTDLRPEYLRFAETHNLIEFAKELFYATNHRNLEGFDELIGIAEQIKKC